MQTAYRSHPGPLGPGPRGAREYRHQEIMGASPLHLVVMTYDVAIRACQQQDRARAAQAVAGLRDALNFDYGDVAVGLFSLYQWILDCIRQDDYAEALKTLRSLREAWATVEQRLSPEPAAELRAELGAGYITQAQWATA